MAKYQITHSCGHTIAHNIVGTNVHGERERKVDWLASRPCPDCYRGQQQTQQTQHTADLNADLNLPQLTGSPKQITWADDIRAQAIVDTIGRAEGRGATPEQIEQTRQIITIIVDNHTDARWWIDRNEGAHMFAADWAQAAKILEEK